MKLESCGVVLSVVDSQESVNRSVFLTATGTISNAGATPRSFVQTFLLVPESAQIYYVRNNILRFTSPSPAKDDAGRAAELPKVEAPETASGKEESKVDVVPAGSSSQPSGTGSRRGGGRTAAGPSKLGATSSTKQASTEGPKAPTQSSSAKNAKQPSTAVVADAPVVSSSAASSSSAAAPLPSTGVKAVAKNEVKAVAKNEVKAVAKNEEMGVGSKSGSSEQVLKPSVAPVPRKMWGAVVEPTRTPTPVPAVGLVDVQGQLHLSPRSRDEATSASESAPAPAKSSSSKGAHPKLTLSAVDLRCSVFVRGVPAGTNGEALKALLAVYGDVVSVDVRPKGFAFVDYATEAMATRAVAECKAGLRLGTTELHVEERKPLTMNSDEPRSRTGGRSQGASSGKASPTPSHRSRGGSGHRSRSNHSSGSRNAKESSTSSSRQPAN